jgi:hypothetical protein
MTGDDNAHVRGYDTGYTQALIDIRTGVAEWARASCPENESALIEVVEGATAQADAGRVINPAAIKGQRA